MVAASLGIIDDHTVAADKAIDQSMDADGTHTRLAVGDNAPGLRNVSGDDFRLQTHVDRLQVHTAVSDLTALKPGTFHLAHDRQDGGGNLIVVDAPIAIA